MTKKEFLEYLIPALELLERVEHVTDLFKLKRCEELDVISGEIDHTELEKFFYGGEFQPLTNEDIPDEYKVTWAVYLHNSDKDEYDIMEEEAYLWIESLRNMGTSGEKLAKWLDKNYINAKRTFAEMLGKEI